jgi:hypothetical protein
MTGIASLWMTRMIACLAALCLAFGMSGTLAARATEAATPPQQAIDGQIRAFLADRDAVAYSFAAPNVRLYFPTVESFMGMVKGGYSPVHRPQTWDFGRMRSEADGTVYQEVLITDQTGKNWTALYTVAQQPDGSWKITGVSLRKADTLTM